MGAHAVGRFEIQGEAGSGAAGTVYAARDPSTGGRVAVKVLRGLTVADTARFAREARLLAQVRHSGVVRYVDHGTTDEGYAYLVMEWLDGEDLRSRLVRIGISIDETVQLGVRLAEALAAIHALGIVHRDLKPANVFLPGGSIADAKIIDFGLVHTEWASLEVTRTGMVVGTPTYMSPEQARGQRVVDARADLFSLGCVLFKCLAGHAPFEGASVIAVLTKVLLDDAPRLRSVRPEVPAALDDVVARLLRKEREQRPPDAGWVARALAAVEPVGDLGDAMEPAPPSRLSTGLTTAEQRVSAVLLVGKSEALPGDSQTDEAPASFMMGETTKPPPPASPSASATWVTPPKAPPVSMGETARPPAQPETDETRRNSTRPPPAALSVRAVVEAHGGQIDRLLDGTRVVTQATPGVATDQAARAARCALALRAVLPDAPMAIATGRGEMGRRYTTGDTIERAAALLAGLAAAGEAEIAIDRVTAALLDAGFEVDAFAMGEIPNPPPPAFRLLGMRAPGPSARTLLGRTTPLVGREWEISSIASIFRDCVEEGEARPVLVTAAAGMGKSRLAHEALASLRHDAPQVEVWWGRGDPLRAGSALGLLGQVVRSLAEEAPVDAQRRRFAERIARWVPEQEWVAEILGEIAGLPFPGEAGPALRAARSDARIMSESVHQAWEALVSGASRKGPLVVVLDDLQWADAATIRLVGATLRNLERRPWFVLALGRPEVHHVFPRLWAERSLQEIRLAPLTRRACERLGRQVLGDRAGAGVVERIALQCDGNAFFLEELIRAVAEAPVSTGAPVTTGAPPPSTRRAPTPPTLPESVLAMVQARLEGLDAGTRRILRAASVFGQVFWAGGVDALLGASQIPGGWVEDLVDRELVALRPESRFAGEREMSFRHGLLREGAYATLTEADRVLGHALAGNWLESRGERDSAVLAHHFELGLDEQRAARHHQAAALAALRAADLDAAIASADRALTRATTEDVRAACLGLLCEAYSWRDDQDRALASALEVERLAAPGSEPWIRAMAVKQSAALMLGRVEDVGAAILALGNVTPAPGTAAMMVQALAVSVFLLCFGLQFPMAEVVVTRIAALSAAAGRDEPLTLSLLEFSRTLVAAWGHGDAWAALRHARLAQVHGGAVRNAPQVAFARVFTGTSLWSLGQLDEAEAELRAVSATAGDDLIAATATLYLGLVLVDRGSLDEAQALAQHRIDSGRAASARLGALREAEGHWLLGEIAVKRGDLAEGEREILAGAAVLRPAGLLWHLAATRLVDIRLRRGAVASALALATDLVEELAYTGGHGLRGTLVRLLHAEALRASGDLPAARAALLAARDDLRARAARIDDPDARARFLAVPENARVLALSQEWLGT